MQILSYILLISAFFDIGFAVLVFMKARKKEHELAKYYLLLFSVVGLWEFLMWVSFFVNLGDKLNRYLDQFTIFFGAFSAFLFFLFVWILLQRKVFSLFAIRVFAVMVFLLFVISLFPRTYVIGRDYYSELTYDFHLIPGSFILIAYAFGFFVFFLIILLLLKGFRQIDSPLVRIRTKIIGTSILLTYLFNCISSIIFPLYLNFISGDYYLTATEAFIVQQAASVISLSLVSLAVAYAITRYRFMNLKIEIGQHLLYIGILFTVLIAYILLVTFFKQHIHISILLILSVFFLFLYYQYLDKRLRFFLDSFFFLKKIDISKSFRFPGDDTIDSLRDIREWIALTTQELVEQGFSVVNIYMLQRQHNRYIDYAENDTHKKYIWAQGADVTLMNECSDKNVFLDVDNFAFGRRGVRDFNIVCQVRYKGCLYAVILIKSVGSAWSESILDGIIKKNAYSCYGVIQVYESVEGIRRTAKEMIYSEYI